MSVVCVHCGGTGKLDLSKYPLHKRLKILRGDSTRRSTSDGLEVSYGFYSNAENNLVSISPRLLKKIAEYYGIDLKELKE